VAGPDATGAFADIRTNIDATVGIENNGGFTGALVMLAATDFSWCDHRLGFLDQIGVHVDTFGLNA
jgi:hypothetical protein